MKKLLLASMMLLTVVTAPVMAADLAVKTPPPTPAPVFNWTGFYVGGNVGGAWSNNNASLSFPDPLSAIDPLTVNTGGSAVIGGVQEGFNWQFAPTWVWGIEADWSFTNAGRAVSQQLTVSGIPGPFSSSSLSTKLDWVGSARNRLGYLVTPNLLVYGTGGAAGGKIEYAGSASFNNPFSFIYNANTGFSRTAVGWTAGGGLEWMITEHWLLRGEYLFYDLSSSQDVNSINNLTFKGGCILGRPGCPPPPQATAVFSWANMSLNVVRAALSYKF